MLNIAPIALALSPWLWNPSSGGVPVQIESAEAPSIFIPVPWRPPLGRPFPPPRPPLYRPRYTPRPGSIEPEDIEEDKDYSIGGRWGNG